MRSSRPDSIVAKSPVKDKEACDFAQLGLDFVVPSDYYCFPRKELQTMNPELLQALEHKINDLVGKYSTLKEENNRLVEENQRLLSEREGFKSNIDSILGKLEGL